jgi:calcineurin-like phosphoesterase family protein
MKRLLILAISLAAVGMVFWPRGKSGAQTSDVVLIGAGDVADGLGFANLPHAFATAALIEAYPSATVFVAGDTAYNHGTDEEFLIAYDPTWGRFRQRTIPVVGNHEYGVQRGIGYYNYFGPLAGNPVQGYYSLNLGAWHIVVLNSNCNVVGCSAGGAQETWLKNDLATNTTACTLAFWHEPLYTSSTEVSPATDTQPLWADLYNSNAELVVSGHAHDYERFAPQDANGNLDLTRGIIEIVAGTGGDGLFPLSTTPAPNEVVRDNSTYGVLKLTLHATSFDFQFIPVAGSTFTDSGTEACH